MHSFLLAFSLLLATASQCVTSPAQRSAQDILMGSDYLAHLAANTCTRAGQVICSQRCNEVILCVSDGQGGFQHVVLEACSSDSRCSAELETCVSGSTACGVSTAGGIECHDIGFFPDPYNCSVYHFCIELYIISQPMVCPSGYAYNALTSDCSLPATDPICTDGPIPPCTSVGESGAFPANPSIYYVCTTNSENQLIPSLYRCHNGQVYDPTATSCVDSTSPPTSPVSTTTPSPGPVPTTVPTPGTSCWPPGHTVADPDDCRHYYVCSDQLAWLHAACSYGFYFNPVHGHCELGWC